MQIDSWKHLSAAKVRWRFICASDETNDARATGMFSSFMQRRPLGVLGGNYSGPAPLFPTCQWTPINASDPKVTRGEHNRSETPGRRRNFYPRTLLINDRSCVCSLLQPQQCSARIISLNSLASARVNWASAANCLFVPRASARAAADAYAHVCFLPLANISAGQTRK